MFCSKCGAELMEGDMFCAKCGTRFDTEFFNEQSMKTETNIEEKQHYEYHSSADKIRLCWVQGLELHRLTQWSRLQKILPVP